MIGVGDVLAVRTTSGWVARLINVGAALRGRPAMDNHVVIAHHVDASGKWWGLEGKPGGVGWATLNRYLADPWTVNNTAQPKTEQQRYDIAVAAEAMMGTPYDWSAIAAAGMAAIGGPVLWRANWGGQGPPGHVICSAYAAYLYTAAGLDCPAGGRTVTPADWTEWALEHTWNTLERGPDPT